MYKHISYPRKILLLFVPVNMCPWRCHIKYSTSTNPTCEPVLKEHSDDGHPEKRWCRRRNEVWTNWYQLVRSREWGNKPLSHRASLHLSLLSISPDVIHSISWPISAIPNARWIVRQQYFLRPWNFSVAKWNAGKDTRKETTPSNLAILFFRSYG